MKNLKKVLALVLAVAMFASLAISASATKFSDKSTVKNTEAVDVVSSIGVINGFTDGTFRGTENVTRAQMAKMIAFVLNSGDDVGDYYSAINAFTDCNSHWAKGYIAYCNKVGVVAGVGSGKFEPDGSVTGTQAAKMLLVALGYDPTIQGYLGSSWATATLKDAKDAGLLKSLGKVDMSAALSRDSAAQMIFNALKATMVEYDTTGNSITVGGVVVNTSASKPTKVTNDDDDPYANISDDQNGDENDDPYYVELGEEYFEDLAKDASDSDGFKRPAHTWTNGKTSIGTYADSPDETYVVADAGETLNTILTDDDYMNYDTDEIDDTDAFKAYVNAGSIAKTTKLQLGDTVETFDTDDDDVIDVVVVRRYEYAKIDELDTSLSSSYTKQGATTSIDLVDMDDGAVATTLYDAYDDDSDKVLPGFDASTYKEDTVLAVAVSAADSDVILDSYVATVVTGTPASGKAVDIDDDGAVIAGYAYVNSTKYIYAGTLEGVGDGETVSYTDDAALYLTAEGYVIGIDTSTTASLDDVYFVTGMYYTKSSTGTANAYAQAVSLKEGKVEAKKIELQSMADQTDADVVDGALVADADTLYSLNKLYTFTDKDANSDDGKIAAKSGNDKYTAKPFTGTGSSDYAVVTDDLSADVTSSSTSVKFGASTNTTGDGDSTSKTSKLYITSSTGFLGVESSGDDIDVSTNTGLMKAASATHTISIFKDGGSEALYVVYYGEELNTAVSTDDTIYIAPNQDFDSNNDGTIANVYYMADKSNKDVTVDESLDVGFWKYSEDDDSIYSLSSAGSQISTDVTSSTDGYKEGLVITSTYNSTLTGDLFDDVDFSDATIIDSRTSDDKDEDVYSGNITSAGTLTSAVKKGEVTADVYVEDGDVTFICIIAVEDD